MTAKPDRVKAREYGDQRVEALGQKPHIDFELSDGSVIRIPHPLRLGDEARGRYEAYLRGDGLDREPVLDEDGKQKLDEAGRPFTRLVRPASVGGETAEPLVVRQARAILGERDHQKLLEEGVTSSEIVAAFEGLAELPKDDV